MVCVCVVLDGFGIADDLENDLLDTLEFAFVWTYLDEDGDTLGAHPEDKWMIRRWDGSKLM